MNEWITGIASFGILLTIGAYEIGVFLRNKTKNIFCNPTLIATAIIIGVLLLLRIDYTTYYDGARFISYLLTPTTVCLAIPLYKQLRVLKENFVAIIAGIFAGVLSALASVYACSLVFRLSHEEYITMLPKSITTAIGISLTEEYGGYPAITVIAITITAMTGYITAEHLCRIFSITHPVAVGLAFGASAHAMGTSRAIEIGEVEGAMSTLALAVCGIVTAVVIPLFVNLI